MAPKKASTASAKKAAPAASHPTYQDMIKDALIQLKDRAGSSRQALKKYVRNNNKLGDLSDATFNSRFNSALSKGSETGAFDRPKGPSGPVKLGKGKTEKPAAKPKATATATKSKAAAPKAAPKEKTAAPKKAAASTKKSAAKPKPKTKANTGKSRKTSSAAAAAPAVEDTPTVLGKTKSGRVTKNKAPPAGKKAAPATKKATAKKATGGAKKAKA